jgi:hypothetical protein
MVIKKLSCAIHIQLTVWSIIRPLSEYSDEAICFVELTPSRPEIDMVISSWNSFTIYWEKPDKVHSHYPIIGYRIEWRNFSDELRIHEDTVLPVQKSD